MKKVNYALVGFGGIAENRIAAEGFCCDKTRFKAADNYILTGATDIDAGKKSTVEKLGLKWYDSLELLLADSEIDAVFIATNNSSHAETAMTAMNAGKHCFIEKPIATTLRDAEKLKEKALELGLSLAVDHMMIFNSYNIKAKELVANSAIGDINDIDLHMEFLYGANADEAATWRCSNQAELGGPIGDVASHCLYMAEFLFGSNISTVSCIYTPELLDLAVENGAIIKFKMENGMQGTVRVAFSSPRGGLVGTLSNLGYEIYGTEGVIRSYGTMFQLSGHEGEPVKLKLNVSTANGDEEVKIDAPRNIYQAVIAEHAESIINNTPKNGEDGLRSLKMIFAAHESACSGGKIVNIA